MKKAKDKFAFCFLNIIKLFLQFCKIYLVIERNICNLLLTIIACSINRVNFIKEHLKYKSGAGFVLSSDILFLSLDVLSGNKVIRSHRMEHPTRGKVGLNHY